MNTPYTPAEAVHDVGAVAVARSRAYQAVGTAMLDPGMDMQHKAILVATVASVEACQAGTALATFVMSFSPFAVFG